MAVEIFSSLLNYAQIWLSLIIAPIKDFNALWGVIPLYVDGFLMLYYEQDTRSKLLTGGFILSFVGLDWARRLLQIGIPIQFGFQWILVLIFLGYGVLALIVVLMKKLTLVRLLGKRKFVSYFGISFYPLQTGIISHSSDTLISILVMVIPVWIILELIFLRKNPIEL